MCERITAHARDALRLARDEAARLNHPAVGAEHVLLALTGQEPAARALRRLGVTADEVRREVARLAPPGCCTSSPGQAPRVKRALDLAVEEADRLGHDSVGPEHLLLGLLDEGDTVAARALANLGLTPDAVRAEVRRLAPAAKGPSQPSEVAALGEVIEELKAEKARAIAEEAYERAGRLMRLEGKLEAVRRRLRAGG